MAQTSSFYELAALLLPILMLSGYVTQRLPKPSPITNPEGRDTALRAVVIAAFVLFPVLAELSALTTVAVGQPVPSFASWLVGLAVAFGLWSVALAWGWPWIRRTWAFGGNGNKALHVVSLLLLIASTGSLLRSGANAQDEGRRLREAVEALGEPRPLELTIATSEHELTRLDARERYLDARREEKQIGSAAYLIAKRDIQRKRDKASGDIAVAKVEADTRRRKFEGARLLEIVLEELGP